MLFLAPTFTSVRFESPTPIALKVRMQTWPSPLTPATPGGRDAETVTNPLPSSRCESATGWPSPASRPPVSTFTSCSTLGSNWSCSGMEKTSCAFDRYTDAVKVLPIVCVELGGSTVRATDGPVVASVFAVAGDPGTFPPAAGGIACCFICWTMAEAALAALVVGAAAGAALSGVLSSSCPADRRTSMSLKVPVSIERVFRRVNVDSRTMCGTRTNTISSCCTSWFTEPKKYLRNGISDRPGVPLLVVLSSLVRMPASRHRSENNPLPLLPRFFFKKKKKFLGERFRGGGGRPVVGCFFFFGQDARQQA